MAVKQLISKSSGVYPKTEKEKLDDLRCRFYRVYPNLPLFERNNACIVVNLNNMMEPLSWHVCFMEIKNKTKLSRKILKTLGDLEFI